MTTLNKAKIYVKSSPIHGYGVFADEDISVDQLIEQCYMLVFRDPTDSLIDYVFDISKVGHEKDSGMPLGYGAVYNHSADPNATYLIDEEKLILNFKARRPIKRGEEITVTYGLDWFSSRGVQPIEAFTWYRLKKLVAEHRRLVRMLLVCTTLTLALQFLPDVSMSWLYNLLQDSRG